MTLQLIPVEHLKPSAANVRENLGDLTELAASIRARGMLQPLVVGESRNGVYTIIDGHRRFAAAKLAHVKQVPCLTSRAETRSQVVATMLAAALHKGLEPIEQANAFDALRNQGMTVAEIARSTGYSIATVNSRLLLLNLPAEAQQMVASKELPLGEATQLARQVKAQRTGAATPKQQKPSWLKPTHRLAAAVTHRCTHHDTRYVYGRVGCGQCWEAVIREDAHGELADVEDQAVDPIAVQRAVDGDRTVQLTPRERAIAIEDLALKGHADRDIAMLLGCTDRTVLRARQARNVPAAIPRVGGAEQQQAAS